MNILYIGPYRQNTVEGIQSECILNNLLSNNKHVIVSRPIYLSSDKDLNKHNISKDIQKAEQRYNNNIDCLIQHTTINELNPIYSIKKNILIPIVGSATINQNTINKLLNFTTILVDNKIDFQKITHSHNKLQTKTKSFDYDLHLSSINAGKFNINILSAMEKIYFIGRYKENSSLIYNYIQSFIQNVEHRNVALVLFILDISIEDKTLLDQQISHIYQTNNIKHSTNKIVVAPISSSIENIVSAHNTGDIFLNFNNIYNTLNLKLATALKKKIIHFDHDLTFTIQDAYEALPGGYNVISDKSIFTGIKNYIKAKNLGSTSLFKTQHINNII